MNTHYFKLFLLSVMAIVAMTAKAQTGLENIIVEKYYVSNSADSAAAAGVLPAGSVTYRIYADMKPGYNFQALYGVTAHPLSIQTSTSFFNDENYGSTSPNGISTTNIRKFTAMIDSWFSVGAGCAGKVGVRKTVDSDGTLGNANAILANADPSIGFPINGATGRDGLATGTPVSVTFVGINNTGNGDLGVFDGTSQVGGQFSTNNGSIAALGGATGLDTTNIVLIGQFTTNGVLQYQLNVQIGTPTGGTENYVASNPTGSEVTRSFLTGTVGAANQAPTVSITAPTNGSSFITGASISITATAADADGTVSSVEFFVDGTSIGVDNTAPYSATYTGVLGTHALTARATDDLGAQTTSTAVSITVASNPPPTCSITAPASGASFIVGAAISITATATDNGSVASVEFFVDGTSVGVDNTSPYSATYTGVLGSHTLTARATDNLGAQTTSASVSITVANNVPPAVSITAPSNNANFTFPATVTVSATASDADGSVSSVEFFANGTSIGVDNTSPYSISWTATIGTFTLTARATDNLSAQTTSSGVTVNIVDPNALPYKVVTTNVPCSSSSFCLPIQAVATVSNVIGYDMTLSFNPAKLRPTGNVTVFGNLVTPSYVDVANTIDTVTGTMSIALYFNTSAPSTARFSGSGDLICVEFNKTSTVTASDSSIVRVTFLQESYFNGVSSKLADAGIYKAYQDSVLRGNLRFWFDNTPIKYNAANPNQYLQTTINGANALCVASATTYSPDTTGAFNYVVTNGSSLKINKDIPGTTSIQPVVNGFDAFLIRRAILSDPTFIPSVFQAIAMDVNMDGVISAGDLSQTNQRTVLFIPEFRQAWNYNAAGVSNGQPSKDWLFVDSSTTLRTNLAYRISTTFPNDDGVGFSKSRVPVVPFCLPTNISNANSCPNIVPDVYRAVMLGDVNGSYSTTNPNTAYRLNGNDRLVVDFEHVVRQSNYVDIPVSFIATDAVHAIDFAMNFNENSLRFVSATVHGSDNQGLAYFNETDRTLRFTASSVTGLNAFSTSATLRFELLGNSFASSDIEQVEGYLNGESVRVVNSMSTTDIQLVVYPNPTSSVLNVISSADASIEMMDMAGNRVYTNVQVAEGMRTEINTSDWAAGIYLLRVQSNNFVKIEKVIVQR